MSTFFVLDGEETKTYPRRYSALAVKNIQARLIFLARFLLSLAVAQDSYARDKK